MSKNNQNHEENEKDLLQAIWGNKTAVKIYQALDIEKIKFSFFEKDDPTHSIDCYMEAIDFASDFVEMIRSNELLKRAAYERKAQAESGAKYANEIWESRAGINDSKEIRKFSIMPGSSQEFAFKATQNKKVIIVGFSYLELKNLAYKWSFLENDWNELMKNRYSLSNMKSEFHSKINKEQMDAENKAIKENETKEAKDNKNASNVGNIESKEQPSDQIPIKSISLKVKTPICDTSKGGKAFQGWSEDNKVYNVIITKSLIETGTELIKRLINDAAKPGAMLNVYGGIKGECIFVV